MLAKCMKKVLYFPDGEIEANKISYLFKASFCFVFLFWYGVKLIDGVK